VTLALVSLIHDIDSLKFPEDLRAIRSSLPA
jgi:hypothetical protein